MNPRQNHGVKETADLGVEIRHSDADVEHAVGGVGRLDTGISLVLARQLDTIQRHLAASRSGRRLPRQCSLAASAAWSHSIQLVIINHSGSHDDGIIIPSSRQQENCASAISPRTGTAFSHYALTMSAGSWCQDAVFSHYSAPAPNRRGH